MVGFVTKKKTSNSAVDPVFEHTLETKTFFVPSFAHGLFTKQLQKLC